MPKLAADQIHVETAERLLRAHRDLRHVRVRKRADTIILESGPKDDPVPHARLRRATAQWWTLEMPTHTGRWEPTPVRVPIEEAIATLITDYPWTLTDIG